MPSHAAASSTDERRSCAQSATAPGGSSASSSASAAADSLASAASHNRLVLVSSARPFAGLTGASDGAPDGRNWCFSKLLGSGQGPTFVVEQALCAELQQLHKLLKVYAAHLIDCASQAQPARMAVTQAGCQARASGRNPRHPRLCPRHNCSSVVILLAAGSADGGFTHPSRRPSGSGVRSCRASRSCPQSSAALTARSKQLKLD